MFSYFNGILYLVVCPSDSLYIHIYIFCVVLSQDIFATVLLNTNDFYTDIFYLLNGTLSAKTPGQIGSHLFQVTYNNTHFLTIFSDWITFVSSHL